MLIMSCIVYILSFRYSIYTCFLQQVYGPENFDEKFHISDIFDGINANSAKASNGRKEAYESLYVSRSFKERSKHLRISFVLNSSFFH